LPEPEKRCAIFTDAQRFFMGACPTTHAKFSSRLKVSGFIISTLFKEVVQQRENAAMVFRP
jgi:hypothetical protein